MVHTWVSSCEPTQILHILSWNDKTLMRPPNHNGGWIFLNSNRINECGTCKDTLQRPNGIRLVSKDAKSERRLYLYEAYVYRQETIYQTVTVGLNAQATFSATMDGY